MSDETEDEVIPIDLLNNSLQVTGKPPIKKKQLTEKMYPKKKMMIIIMIMIKMKMIMDMVQTRNKNVKLWVKCK